jgi:hypothetical protein
LSILQETCHTATGFLSRAVNVPNGSYDSLSQYGIRNGNIVSRTGGGDAYAGVSIRQKIKAEGTGGNFTVHTTPLAIGTNGRSFYSPPLEGGHPSVARSAYEQGEGILPPSSRSRSRLAALDFEKDGQEAWRMVGDDPRLAPSDTGAGRQASRMREPLLPEKSRGFSNSSDGINRISIIKDPQAQPVAGSRVSTARAPIKDTLNPRPGDSGTTRLVPNVASATNRAPSA